jgi:hypothetical protein
MSAERSGGAMGDTPPACVFVSYATADLNLAKFVAGLLERRLGQSGLVFVAKRDIDAGSDPLATMLSERLLRAAALVALCSRDSRQSAWLWWESSSVWTRGELVVPLFVDIEAGDFVGPLTLLCQGRRLFRPDELMEALRTVVEQVAPNAVRQPLNVSELAQLVNLEAEYRRRPRPSLASRLALLEKLKELILEAKDDARDARDHDAQVTPSLINMGLRIRTVTRQLGDDQFPCDLANFIGQAQNAYAVMQWWQKAYAVVESMIVDATV